MRRPMRSAIAVMVGSLAVTLALGAPMAGATKHKKLKPPPFNLGKLTKVISKEEHGKFKAVYLSTEASGTETITIEQDPPKSLFSTTSGEYLDTGTTSYFCGSSNGHETCLSEGSGANPFAALIAIFSPKTFAGDLHQAELEYEARTRGYTVKFSKSSIAGHGVDCVSVTGPSGMGKYCVTSTGILAYEGNGKGQSFVLQSLSTSVSASAFALPAGATTVTLPAGVTLPSSY